MNTNAIAIECPGVRALGYSEFDKRAMTTPRRGEKFIEEFCLECPAMVECGRRANEYAQTLDPEGNLRRPFGVWGGEWHNG